ncbi:unnamed protein product [Medioppia subpectinata]|uniref:Uncharacterized protein n=1 Tax=Medioppia subpectinata TaxID=1979941 RepID=A0A7R9KSC2_9ACAR|nr:unnamed protein product [Medioppia subpectinata]CAG2108926.1 unnamed protein product [Medioppia subpectinata]
MATKMVVIGVGHRTETQWPRAYVIRRPGNTCPFYAKLSSLSEESDRKCRELCEEMSALKASNESEVKALKAQLKTAIDSMETWIEGNNDLKQKLLTYEMSELSEELSALKASKHIIESDVKQLSQEINAQNISYMLGIHIPDSVETIRDLKSFLLTKGVYNENTDIIGLKTSVDSSDTIYMLFDDDYKLDSLCDNDYEILISSKLNDQSPCLSSESDRKITELCEEMSTLKASNESEVKALKEQLKTSKDSMETIDKEINDLKQTVHSLSQMMSKNISDQNMATDLLKQTLSEELSSLKASNHIIESDVKLLAQQMSEISPPVIDLSSSCSSIGSHNVWDSHWDETTEVVNTVKTWMTVISWSVLAHIGNKQVLSYIWPKL